MGAMANTVCTLWGISWFMIVIEISPLPFPLLKGWTRAWYHPLFRGGIQAKKMDPCTSFCISLHPSLGRWHLHAWVSGGNHCRASWVPGSGMGSRGALSIASMLLRRGDELPAIVSLLLWKLGYSIVWFWSMYIYILCNILSGRIMVDIQLRHPSSRIAKTL